MPPVQSFFLGSFAGFALPLLVLYLWAVMPRLMHARRQGLMPGLALAQMRARITGVILRGNRIDLLLDAVSIFKSRGMVPDIEELEVFYLLNRHTVKTPGDLVALADRSGFTAARLSPAVNHP